MKKLLVLGAGTAGTMVVNKLRSRLRADDWQITIVDASSEHHYQPGYLFIPFGTYQPDQVVTSSGPVAKYQTVRIRRPAQSIPRSALACPMARLENRAMKSAVPRPSAESPPQKAYSKKSPLKE